MTDYGANAADMVEQMRSMQGRLDDMSRKLDSMYAIQRVDDDILRKSANSINVIVRLLAGCCRLDSHDLWNTLIVSGALLDNVKPSMDLDSDHIPISHSKVQQLRFIVQDLTKILDLFKDLEAANSTPNNNSDNNNIPSTSTQNKMHSVSPISNTFSSEGQSTSDVSNTDMIKNRYYVSCSDNNSINLDRTAVHSVSTVVDLQEIKNIRATSKIQSTSEYEMLPDSRLTDDIERDNHNDNSITSNRTSVHNNTANIIIRGLQVIKNAKTTSKVQSSSESDMLPDSSLTDDIERDNHNDNLFTLDRTSVHNNTATVIGGLQEIGNVQGTSKIQRTSESEMFPDSCLADGIERDNHNNNSITLDRTSVHNNTATIIGGPKEIKKAPAISQIPSTSGSKMFPDSCSTGIECNNSNVDSTFLGMTPLHLSFSMKHPGASVRLVESEEARALRRKYNNKYRYIDNYKNKNQFHVVSGIKKVTSNVSSGNQVGTKASIINRCLYQPRLILNKFRMTDPYKDFKKSKTSGFNQTNSEDCVTIRNNTNLNNKKKSNDNGVSGSNSAQISAKKKQ